MIWWAVLLFCAAMMLILAEFLLPGGICGSIGVLLLILSGAMAINEYPDQAFFIIVGEALGTVACIVLGFVVIARTGVAKSLKLASRQRPEDGYVSVVSDTSLIGEQGVVFSALRPAGAILVRGRRIDAVSDGTFIEKDVAVRVVEVHGGRVVVEAVADN